TARGCIRSRHAAIEGDPAGIVSCGARRHDHGCLAGCRTHQRRNRTADLHGVQFAIPRLQPQRTDREPALRHLPICRKRLSRVAETCVGRSTHHHLRRAGAEHPGTRTLGNKEAVMNIASVQSTTTSVPAPVASHTVDAQSKLEEKVAVRNLNFYYGGHKALKNVNVSLYTRMVTAFIGPSGCGKSTLLRILNRIYDLYPNQRAEGEVLLDRTNILSPAQDLNYLRARVGMVFQKPTPFPMSIYENIAFGIRLYERLPKSEI